MTKRDLPDPQTDEAVGRTCDEFEAALVAGLPCHSEDYLPATGPPSANLVRELLQLELEYRFRTLGIPTPAEVVDQALETAQSVGTHGLVLANGAPATVGHYRLMEEIACGGSGIVFLARDIRTEQQVALKIPRFKTLLDPVACDRFLNEARAVAKLDHPNIVTLLDSGRDGEVCYMATEYIDGPTLRDWCADRNGQPVPFRQAAQLLRAVSQAVAHAHEQGVLHFDLSPANVMLSATTGDLHPKVTDFGLARVVGEPSPFSQSGILAGTTPYMAPEQVTGQRTRFDHRVDVYALGAILYELLTGRPPFEIDTISGGLMRIAHGYPARPRSLRPDVPANLEAICLQCLEREPNRRYPDAAALADDLRYFLSNGPSRTGLQLGQRLRWWYHRNPSSAAIWAITILAGLTIAGLVAYYYYQLATANTKLEQSNSALATVSAESSERAETLYRRAYSDTVRRAERLLDLGDGAGCRALLDLYQPRPGKDDLRGFDWHLVDRKAIPVPHQELVSFAKAATAVACRGSDKLVAVGGVDGVLRLVDAESGRDRYPPMPHPAPIEFVTFSPDGTRLATAAGEVVRIWPVGSDLPRTEFRGHARRVQALVWSPDGQLLASGGQDATVRIWNPADGTGRLLATAGDSVRSVAWSPDGRSILVGGDEKGGEKISMPRLLDSTTGSVVGTISGDQRPSVTVRFLTNEQILVAIRDGTVRTFDKVVGQIGWKETRRIAVGHPRIHDIAIDPTRTRVAVFLDNSTRVYRLDSSELEAVLQTPAARTFWTGTFLAPGNQVLTCDARGKVLKWDLAKLPYRLSTLRFPG